MCDLFYFYFCLFSLSERQRDPGEVSVSFILLLLFVDESVILNVVCVCV